MDWMRAGLLLIAIACTDAATAGSPWVLHYVDGRSVISAATDHGWREVATLKSVSVFGESDREVGVVTFATARSSHRLVRFDKQSLRPARDIYIEAVEPVGDLSGPAPTLMLTREYAYLVTMTPVEIMKRNGLGGIFYLTEVRLRDGVVESIPLAEIANPRLLDVEGVPVIFAWNGYGFYKFDASTRQIESLVTTSDAQSMAEREKAALRAGKVSGWANYVVVPGAGAFRLSRLGELHHLLDVFLKPTTTANFLDLGPAKNIRRLFPLYLSDRPELGVLKAHGEELALLYIDPLSLAIEMQMRLPDGVDPHQVAARRDGSVLFIDRRDASLKAASNAGIVKASAQLNGSLGGARILVAE
jgi:hypothetical protein